MDIWALIVGLAVIIGIAAGIVQILQYVQERREKKRQPTAEEVAVPSLPTPAVPSNLPPRSEFIGRGKEKTRVMEALASRWPLTCIDGIGGIGKTALALEVARECLQASKSEIPVNGVPTFDGFIWATAKDRELILNDVLDAIARTLDYPGIAQQPLEEKQESVRKLLQMKPYLLIVDNFETITDDAVRDFLLRLPEPSRALITSREQKLRQAWVVSLKGLEQEEALTLIRREGRRLGLVSLEKSEERVLLRLHRATGGAPLAIKWAVGQIKQKGQSLDTVLAALHEARGDIFEEVFARSWSLLSDEARRILMVMPIFAASASRAAIEAASDVHHYALDEGLGQLVEMWLVEASEELDEAKRRYSIHPLTRAFAGARLGENAEWEREARLRTSAHFIDFTGQHGGENWRGYDSLEIEKANILSSIDWCYEVGEWRSMLELMREMTYFLGFRGHWQERIGREQQIIEAAQNLGDSGLLAWMLTYNLGWIYLQQGNYEKSKMLIEEGRRLFDNTANWEGFCEATRYLARIRLQQGAIIEATQMLKDALHVANVRGLQSSVPRIETDLGDLALEQSIEDARQWYASALAKFETLGDEPRMAYRMARLGDVAAKESRWDDAWRLYERAVASSERTGTLESEVYAKHGLASVAHQTGKYELSLALARETLRLYEQLGIRARLEEVQALVERLEGKLSAGKLSADR